MKKLFFTAIALVAFSAVSMANNVKVKKEIEITKHETKLKKVSEDNIPRIDQCMKVYSAYLNYYSSYLGYENSGLARELAQGHFQNCMYGNEGGSASGVLCKQ